MGDLNRDHLLIVRNKKTVTTVWCDLAMIQGCEEAGTPYSEFGAPRPGGGALKQDL